MFSKDMGFAMWNVFVGSETGLFKGVNTVKKTFQNINETNGLDREQEITALCWEDSLESKIFAGLRNQTVKIYDRARNCFTEKLNVQGGEGPIKGLAYYNGYILTAVESGLIRLWHDDEEQRVEIMAGEKLCRMRQNLSKPNTIATGGEENDLKIWDLHRPKQEIFKAKNVRNDFLDLRVPVWITDIHFLPNSEKVITCTRHHQIRQYDPKSSQRRPVINMEFENYPLMSFSLTQKEHQIVVGSSRGRMALIDLRKKAMVHVFKGFAGSIRSVQCHPSLPLVASCGLDRFLRIHDVNTHKLLSKVYLKSRLNSVLVCKDFYSESLKTEAVQEAGEVCKDDDEVDKLWNDMEVVNDEENQKRKVCSQDSNLVCKKKKIRKAKT